ncbi:hypothetical protein FEM48_Zijuj09G0018900 [Ziziphus jujuba var. spinosa]|uniref:Proline-rich protein 3-like n=1 Tax=Ziziphus jujuba var. spinosa TaxID=714518 RepID=A0A978UQ83_ZIZJJ|nr:hypothetical protein FEM48_Zijuj09G0018900 [Ziziphus jujuba var. spinosa]
MALSRLLVSMLLSSLLVIASATNYDQYPPQGPKSDYSDNDNYNPKLPLLTNELLPTDQIAFQGFISCKLGIKDLPLKGALARITCLVEDKNGYERTLSTLSCPTDATGFFFATLSASELEEKTRLTACKAILEESPLKTCNFPTDINNGITGYQVKLDSYRSLLDKNMKLFSLPAFFYTTSEPKPDPNGY